jgi:hypothetical protein
VSIPCYRRPSEQTFPPSDFGDQCCVQVERRPVGFTWNKVVDPTGIAMDSSQTLSSKVQPFIKIHILEKHGDIFHRLPVGLMGSN